MSCTWNVLGLRFERHSWQRTVSWTDAQESTETDMWGRGVMHDHVLCRVQYICRECGMTRDGGFCGCDKARGDQCAARLACIGTNP